MSLQNGMKMQHDSATHDESKGESVIGEHTIWFGLTGMLIGIAVGWLIGLALGYGKLNLPGLAPLASGGAGIPGLIFSSFFGSLFGLIGAVLGTSSEVKKHHGGHERNKHHKTEFVQRLPIYGSIALVFFMLVTLYVIASRGLGIGTPSDQSARVTWNQKNATRVGGRTDSETAVQALQIAYPATRPENSPGTILNLPDDWRTARAATSLIARPFNAALVVTSSSDEDVNREVQRLRRGSAVATAQVVSSPSPGPATEPSPAPTAFQPKTIYINTTGDTPGESMTGNDPASIAAAIDERRANAGGGFSSNVIVVSSESDYRWAMPAAAYSARTGTPVLFVTGNQVPDATVTALQRRNGNARIFVLGSNAIISDEVVNQLQQLGRTTRIEGSDYFVSAVHFAEFRDAGADFGWGRTGRGARQFSNANTILVNGENWRDAVAAAHLARAGKSGALLFTEKDRLPAVVDNYLWRQRPIFAATPAEGPFNHVWVVGSFDRIAYGTQAWADYSQEIEQYMTLSDSAVSGYEALGISWLILSVACGLWILFHAIKRMPDVMPMMKAAWVIFALMLGPIALWLYILSYHGRTKMKHEGMTMWERPLWLQTVGATVMMFAFDMMLMCLAVFLVAYIGFPIIRFNGPLYFIGTSMFLMMVLMYLIALVVMMLVFHTPMTMHERKISSYRKAFMVGLPIMVATMSVESLGMMPTMWWQQMFFLPAMQMPTNDDFTMWSTLLFSVFIGFLVVLPFNYWMVRRGKKMGTM